MTLRRLYWVVCLAFFVGSFFLSLFHTHDLDHDHDDDYHACVKCVEQLSLVSCLGSSQLEGVFFVPEYVDFSLECGHAFDWKQQFQPRAPPKWQVS